MKIAEQGSIHVNGIDLPYEVVGEGPPVVLVHGLGGSRKHWRLQVPALADHYRVITYDLRGHGASDKRGRYMMTDLASDLAALIRALGLGAAHIVGLSLGGMVAFQLAVDHPGMARTLTIVNSGPEVVPRSFRERFALWTRVWLTRLFGPRGLSKMLSRRLFPKPEQEPLRREFRAEMASNNRRAYLNATHAIIGWSVTDRIDRIECPVLVISGDRDYTPVARKEQYLRRLKHGELAVIADSGHATPFDQPEKFNAQLLRFLGSAKSSRDLSNVA